MYRTHKTYIRPDSQMTFLLSENPSLLLFLEHLDIDFCVGDSAVKDICSEYDLDLHVFLLIGNLYNDFFPNEADINSISNPGIIIRYLKNSHKYYKYDKYPEIKRYIEQLKENQDSENIVLIEKFFNSYFKEVLEHLDYEENIAFPYFNHLISQHHESAIGFSAKEYLEHHTDIETKLDDLKSLLLKHIELKKELTIRRKILQSLFDLENDLRIHSIIEEKVLLPIVTRIETNRING